MQYRFVVFFTCSLLSGIFTLAHADSVWVSDQFEIMLRSGPSGSNEIRRMLNSGTKLETLETDSTTGYSRVQTEGGTEGWVLTRYLMGEPPAREQLRHLSGQLNTATEEGSSMSAQLNAINSKHQNANRRIDSLESEREQLKVELGEIKRTASDVLSINSQNKNLRQQLTDTEIRIGLLEEENAVLHSDDTRFYFVTGALVLFGGILLGLILPKMKFQKRSGYDSF